MSKGYRDGGIYRDGRGRLTQLRGGKWTYPSVTEEPTEGLEELNSVPDLRAQLDRERGRIAAARQYHQPRQDPSGSLVSWTYCSCGAMEPYTADDGERILGPARYPCATVRALDG